LDRGLHHTEHAMVVIRNGSRRAALLAASSARAGLEAEVETGMVFVGRNDARIPGMLEGGADNDEVYSFA
jgi:hypothetical protein